MPSDRHAGEGNHEIEAIGEVLLETKIDKHGELVVTDQVDLDVQEWHCDCGESFDEREKALSHLRLADSGDSSD